jgi:trehalose synthase
VSPVQAKLSDYAEPAGAEVIEHLYQLARPLRGKRCIHVNSTAVGGGVAEILHRLVPLQRELEIDASWEVITGRPRFYGVTKSFHNALQGTPVPLGEADYAEHIEVNRINSERLRDKLEAAEFVFIHDPQPAALHQMCAGRKGKWVWRCHIDLSHPYRPVWKHLRQLVRPYDASVFSLPLFAQPLQHPQYLIAPSIDPLSDKNAPLDEVEVGRVCQAFSIDPNRPVLLQVSRFDRFKDPLGVIAAYKIVRKYAPVQLVLAGGSAEDDPEGAAVLEEVRAAAGTDPDIRILALPPDAHREINALQRRADIVLQKSLKEGFGLTVTEALWKSKPVIGGDTGGITLQVIDNHTGFLVSSPEGAALRIRYLLQRPNLRSRMGEKAHRLARDHFLLTRHLREYLALMIALQESSRDRIAV